MFTHVYHSAISLLVIDLTFLEGRDGKLVVMDLALIDTHSNRASSYVFKTPTAGKKYQRLTPEWIMLLTIGVIGMMAMYYIQS